MLQTVTKRLKCVSELPQKIESQAELVASQSCSQSAAEPLHQAKTAEGLTSRSWMTRTHLDVNAQIRYVTIQMKCGVTRTGSGEMGASPETQRSLRAGWCIFGRVALPAESVD